MSTLAIATAIPAAMMQPNPALPPPAYVEVYASNLLEQIEMVKGLPPAGYAPVELAVAPLRAVPVKPAVAAAPLAPLSNVAPDTALARPQPAAAAPVHGSAQPVLAFALPAAAPLPKPAPVAPQAIWVQPEATLVQPQGTEALPQEGLAQGAIVQNPVSVTYNMAPGEGTVQGPPSADPLADDIVWANGQTAYHKRQVEREAWRKIVPYEIAWQLLNALDAAQTIDCSNRPSCNEANPLFGKKPSVGTVLGIKGALAVGHFFLMRHLAHRNWKTARTAEIGTILVQGIIDGLNFRYAFK